MPTHRKKCDLSHFHFGLHKTTLIDFPGRVAATVFLPGCNLRCPYCHNPELVLPGAAPPGLISGDELRSFLKARQKLLSGICITGGEPLASPCLEQLISLIRDHGFKIKLDTNGTFPDRLQQLQVDYIALDLKTAPAKYHLLGGGPGLGKRVEQSIRWIIQSGLPYEFRTTVVPGLVDTEDIRALTRLIPGAARYILTQFRPGITLDPTYAAKTPYPLDKLHEMQQAAAEAGVTCLLRLGSQLVLPKNNRFAPV